MISGDLNAIAVESYYVFNNTEKTLQAILTKSWNETINGALDATMLFEQVHQEIEFNAHLDTAVSKSDGALTIQGLDALFRQQSEGFNRVKVLVGVLADYEHDAMDANASLCCGCNALVYGFLVGAKNFDFVLPEADDKRSSSFRQELPLWQSTIRNLEAFEREGEALADTDLRNSYLRLRPIMMRSSARDEQRCLCNLLMSGPSTTAELKNDLGLSNNLLSRVIAPFVSAGVVERMASSEKYVISQRALPLALFLVRESIGVDPLSTLGG